MYSDMVLSWHGLLPSGNGSCAIVYIPFTHCISCGSPSLVWTPYDQRILYCVWSYQSAIFWMIRRWSIDRVELRISVIVWWMSRAILPLSILCGTSCEVQLRVCPLLEDERADQCVTRFKNLMQYCLSSHDFLNYDSWVTWCRDSIAQTQLVAQTVIATSYILHVKDF